LQYIDHLAVLIDVAARITTTARPLTSSATRYDACERQLR
jgi:hypothetical protein